MEYLPIRLKLIKSEIQLAFDISIFFKETFLVYAKNGESLSEEKLKKLKSQKITKFFINSSSENQYRALLTQAIEDVKNNNSICLEDKIDVIESVAQTALDNIQDGNITKDNFSGAEQAAGGIKDLLLSEAKALSKLIGKKAPKADQILNHSINVCSIVIKFGDFIGLSDQEVEDLAVAALIHDMGLMKFDESMRNMFFRPRRLLSFEDKLKYGEHCQESMLLFQEKKYINSQVQTLVMYHEETLKGEGPYRKKNLSKLEHILSMVNHFDKERFLLNLNAVEACDKLLSEMTEHYDEELVKQFLGFIKLKVV